MSFSLRRNPYRKLLHESAQATAPSEEQYKQILQSVMAATEQSTNVQYADAVALAEKMMCADYRNNIYRLVVSGTAAALVGAGFLFVISVNTPIYTGAMNDIFEIEESGVPLAAAPGIFADLPAGYAVEEYLSAAQADLIFDPLLEDYHFSEDSVTLHLGEGASDILWNAVCGMDFTVGEVLPIATDEENRTVTFALPTKRLDIFISNEDGHLALITISPEAT